MPLASIVDTHLVRTWTSEEMARCGILPGRHILDRVLPGHVARLSVERCTEALDTQRIVRYDIAGLGSVTLLPSQSGVLVSAVVTPFALRLLAARHLAQEVWSGLDPAARRLVGRMRYSQLRDLIEESLSSEGLSGIPPSLPSVSEARRE